MLEVYGLEPEQLKDVKGLQGDTSDNIPGVPGIGEKTALSIIKEYGSIENLYSQLEAGQALDIKGKTREKIIENKDLAVMSKILGTINLEVPIEETINSLSKKEWNNNAVLSRFKELKFNRYIVRFNLRENEDELANLNPDKKTDLKDLFEIIEPSFDQISNIMLKAKEDKELIYYLDKELDNDNSKIIKKKITSIGIKQENKVYYINIDNVDSFIKFKEIFEDESINKIGYKLKEDYVVLKDLGISMKGLYFDVEIAAYLLDPTASKYEIETLSNDYLNLDLNEYIQSFGLTRNENKQINLFDSENIQKENSKKYEIGFITYSLSELQKVLSKKLEEQNGLKLFNEIEMPLSLVLAKMQYEGMYIDKQELVDFGLKLKDGLEELTKQIYELAGEEFNINSTQQLGVILFEKLKLTITKKTKTGYSTDVDSLEKIKWEHPIVDKILEYRSLMKLNSTYVEGMLPYINERTNRIHSYFHQTVTATGRISSTEPNLQNIPTRFELGKQLRKVFKPKDGYVFVDADYSQVELRVLAHISQDQHMLDAFRNGDDIHRQAASKVLGIPMEEVTKEQRSSAKAVNFGIVYGISDFGLAQQLGISRKKAKEYIEQYLEKYSGIDSFMKQVVEEAKEKGYVETLFNRRRYIPELKSNNYMVREFGKRAAMNTPIQGTAADIMKIAMVNLNKELENSNIDAKIILQVHDELILEVAQKDKEHAKELLKKCMESAVTLTVPLEVEVSEADNWYDCK